MKTTKQILCLLCSLVCACGLSAQTITGKLTDEQNQPLPYANVVILSLPDSAFVNGTVSAEDGSFSLNATAPDQIIRITSVGYNTVYKPVQPADLGTVRLIPDTQLLNEVVIKGDLPRTRVKGDAMVTTVTGSILEKPEQEMTCSTRFPVYRQKKVRSMSSEAEQPKSTSTDERCVMLRNWNNWNQTTSSRWKWFVTPVPVTMHPWPPSYAFSPKSRREKDSASTTGPAFTTGITGQRSISSTSITARADSIWGV